MRTGARKRACRRRSARRSGRGSRSTPCARHGSRRARSRSRPGRRAAGRRCPRRSGRVGLVSGGAAPPAAEDLQALGQDLLQLGDRAPLQEHVPVRARRLGLLGLRLVTVDDSRHGAVGTAFPGDRDLRVGREGDREPVPTRAQVLSLLARRQLRVAVGLVAHGSEPTTAQRALTHLHQPPGVCGQPPVPTTMTDRRFRRR